HRVGGRGGALGHVGGGFARRLARVRPTGSYVRLERVLPTVVHVGDGLIHVRDRLIPPAPPLLEHTGLLLPGGRRLLRRRQLLLIGDLRRRRRQRCKART